MSDRWAWWRKALEGEFGPIHENDPQPGWYRMRHGRHGPWVPVRIALSGDGLIAEKAGRCVDPGDVWTWCCRYPVAEAEARAVLAGASVWPDGAPGRGHNSRAMGEDLLDGDSFASLAFEAEMLCGCAETFLATTEELLEQRAADRAAQLACDLTALEKKLDAARTREKHPALEACRATDARWKPVVQALTDHKRAVKERICAFLIRETERLRALGRFDAVRAGPHGARVSLRVSTDLVVDDARALRKAYGADERFWALPPVLNALADLAERDLAAGRCVEGAHLAPTYSAV
jgi:hypothetical protein